ncbi:hypothetical protein VTN77DRAFT_2422 [Rasamsonia byssochlamydoides]|uniref:uncharacterized protein n=1 Tax=Rasamsonia byssochlamydoides TaxID=89139 RepID=UPI0037441D3C
MKTMASAVNYMALWFHNRFDQVQEKMALAYVGSTDLGHAIVFRRSVTGRCYICISRNIAAQILSMLDTTTLITRRILPQF